MPRKRIRTTNNRSYSSETLKQACKEVLENSRSVRNVAIQFGLPRITLKRYVDKCRDHDLGTVNFRPSNEHLMVFSQDKELLLKKYLQEACNIHYGLSAKQGRRLAYEFAVANNKTIKESWIRDGMAGREWMFNFMGRHRLSLRTPEQTSLSRATSFNKENVQAFFKNLRELKNRYKLHANYVYNLDETGVTTVHKPPKVLASTGKRSVGQMTSAERGVLVTLVAIIGATGRYVPPYFIFPRVHFKDNMLHGAPTGSKGAATPSGWMRSELFLPVLQHFAQHERPSKEHPKLMIIDNHESHLSITALDFAKENGIILLTLPPHCSHKLQPLDVAVLKKCLVKKILWCRL
ncbi:uncharacterized protein [Diabrotica undecimpunctata]|uniref:uncharacterized protein n=1 Tax=Diabrotica undecimpunctata TaxID=50387 RepID=UPI003B63FD0E